MTRAPHARTTRAQGEKGFEGSSQLTQEQLKKTLTDLVTKNYPAVSSRGCQPGAALRVA